MSKTILVADDSPTIQKVVELTFMDEDFEVVAVSSGDEALSRLEQTGVQVVIADIHMPGPDGYEVCRRVKEKDPDLPVLLLVGTFEPFDEREFATSEADGYLKKPFDSQELFRRVEELLATAAEPGETVAEEPAAAPPELVADDDLEEDVEAVMVAEEAGEPSEILELAPDLDLEAEPEGEVAPPPAPVAEAAQEALPEGLGGPIAEAGSGMEAEPTSPPREPLSTDDVERIARRVAELLGDQVLREVSWEVVPDLAEVVIRDRLRELEDQID